MNHSACFAVFSFAFSVRSHSHERRQLNSSCPSVRMYPARLLLDVLILYTHILHAVGQISAKFGIVDLMKICREILLLVEIGGKNPDTLREDLSTFIFPTSLNRHKSALFE
jgi:hypothetical protein